MIRLTLDSYIAALNRAVVAGAVSAAERDALIERAIIAALEARREATEALKAATAATMHDEETR